MKKIGFIDHSIDEWHANNYPALIRKAAAGADFTIALAWEKTPAAGKRDLAAWCTAYGVNAAAGIEEVVSTCDCLIVLAPDHPESHETLADLPLRSGKPVYIDKPLAPDLAAAVRMLDKAQAHNTPVMSCSALRYGSALQNALSSAQAPFSFAAARGNGTSFAEYAIHQIEMIVMALGTGATRVMYCGNNAADLLLIDYADGRRASLNLINNTPYQITLAGAQGDTQVQPPAVLSTMDDYFPRFIDAMLGFFSSAKAPICRSQMLEIAAILETACTAQAQQDTWCPVPVSA